jgi:putative membrane protein
VSADTQTERTALAWRRTALGVAVGGVVALRVTGPVLGVGAAVAAIGSSLLAAGAWWLTGRQNRPAAALLAVSVAAALIGALAVAFVLAS